jgi:predicted DCC family thiol-disulfide oxidoreductase YuxK
MRGFLIQYIYNMKVITEHPVILFDGICNLCNSSVRFVIKHDPKHIFRFASLQSNCGKSILEQFRLPADNFNSFILLKSGNIYTKSTAALMVAKNLKGAIQLLYVFIIVPAFLRNIIYNIIAKNRYKWFGKQETCLLPAVELKALFIE